MFMLNRSIGKKRFVLPIASVNMMLSIRLKETIPLFGTLQPSSERSFERLLGQVSGTNRIRLDTQDSVGADRNIDGSTVVFAFNITIYDFRFSNSVRESERNRTAASLVSRL